MRLAGILTFLFFAGKLSAQQVSIVIIDSETKLPVAGATVQTKSSLTFTNSAGTFNLGKVIIGDTIKITHISYKTYQLVIGQGLTPLTIYLKPNNLILNQVFVKGFRNPKQDSLNNRKDFAKIFAYKPTGVGDIFIKRSPYERTNLPNNTSELVSINLLQVISLLSKHKDKTSRLQQALLRDEQDSYTAKIFSKEKVKRITNLSGDSLQVFMINYQPDRDKLIRMTAYDLSIYISKCYADFKKRQSN